MKNFYLPQGKISVLVDGQFGSTGKGLYASFIGDIDHIDFCVTNGRPNAGHTANFRDGRGDLITRHLPIAALSHRNKRSTIYLCAGSIIDPDILFDEIETLGIDPDRICIHPRAAVIQDKHKEAESNGSSVSKIASTQKGVGAALADKILRGASLAETDIRLKPFVRKLPLDMYMKEGCVCFMEVPQGVGLGINSGYAYPFCTANEISISQALSDAQIHPKYLGKTFMSIRTYPIRVGNLMDENGKEIGYSGPFYTDGEETTWEELGLEPELTTVTKRVRRVAKFSLQQYKDAVQLIRPDYVLLNFVNQLSSQEDFYELMKITSKVKPITHFGCGPTIKDVF